MQINELERHVQQKQHQVDNLGSENLSLHSHTYPCINNTTHNTDRMIENKLHQEMALKEQSSKLAAVSVYDISILVGAHSSVMYTYTYLYRN